MRKKEEELQVCSRSFDTRGKIHGVMIVDVFAKSTSLRKWKLWSCRTITFILEALKDLKRRYTCSTSIGVIITASQDVCLWSILHSTQEVAAWLDPSSILETAFFSRAVQLDTVHCTAHWCQEQCIAERKVQWDCEFAKDAYYAVLTSVLVKCNVVNCIKRC